MPGRAKDCHWCQAAPRREMVAPLQHVALTRASLHAPAVATVGLGAAPLGRLRLRSPMAVYAVGATGML